MTPSRAACYPIVTVKVAVLTANELVVTRTLWSQRANPTMKLSVAVANGEVTVAWGYYELNGGSESCTCRLRPAQRPLAAIQASRPLLGSLGHGRQDPRLPAAGPCPRRPGARRLERLPQRERVPPPDGRRRARLARSRPRLRPSRPVANAPKAPCPPTTGRQRHTSTAPAALAWCSRNRAVAALRRVVTLTRGPVSDLSLSLSGADEGLASWVAGARLTDEAVGNAPGPCREHPEEIGVRGAVMLTRVGERAYDSRSARSGRGL